MKLKVCGLREPQNIEQICQLDIHYVGFHFHKASPEFIGDRISFDFVRSLPKHIRKAGVFADQDSYAIFSAVARYDLDLVQLQGKESPAFCRELRPYVKVAKAFEVSDHFNVEILERYIPHVDYFLFDVNTNGSFPDEVLQRYPYEVPFFLRGAISGASLPSVGKLRCSRLFGLDLSTGPGPEVGLSDPSAIRAFIDRLRRDNQGS